MPRPRRTKITSSRANAALPKPTASAANRSRMQQRSTDELNIDATQQRAGRAGRAQIDAETTTSRVNPKDPSQPHKPATSPRRISRAPSTSSSDDFIHHEDPNEPLPHLPSNPAPNRSEAPNHSPTIYGAHCTTTKHGGRITGRVRATAVPAATNMGGFEEFLASSSPRVDRASFGGRESDIGLGVALVDAAGAGGRDGAAALSRPPSAHGPRGGQATPSFLQMSAFKRRPRQPSLLQLVQQQQRGQQEQRTTESEMGDSEVEDSVLRDLEGSSPQGGLRVEALNSSGARKRKAREMLGAGDDDVDVPSSPPALRDSASPVADEVPDVAEDDQAEVQVPATQDQEIEIFEDEDADPRPTTDRRLSRRSAGSRPSQPALPHEPSRDRVRSSRSPPHPAAASPEVTPPTEALPPQQAARSRPKDQPPARRRMGRVMKPKHAPPTQRSPSPPLSAPSPISSPSSSAAQQTERPAPPAATSAAPSDSRKRVKITRRRSDGRPITNTSKPSNHPTHTSTQEAPAAQPPVKTADLRALLPKRRRVIQPQTDTFDLPSSSPGRTSTSAGDDSEMQPSRSKARPRTKATATKRQPLKARNVNARVVSRLAGREKGKSKADQHKTQAHAQTSKAKATQTKDGKTYARPTREPTIDADAEQDRDEASDADAQKDNGDAETTFHEASKSRELASAAKHFEEVDDWEMSFESCDVNGGSSSPWR